MRLLDDVLLRQVLATRDLDDRAMLVRLNLAAMGALQHGRFIGTGRTATPAPGPTAADLARHPSAGRHAKPAQHASDEDRAPSAA